MFSVIKFLNYLVIISILGAEVHGLFETCDYTYTVAAGQSITINSPSYPNGFYPTSSCRYYVTGPSGYYLSLSCNINIRKNTQTGACIDYFYVGADGNKTFYGGEYLCGQGTVARNSLFNYVAFGYASSATSTAPQVTGAFTCTVTALVQPCDCGWTVSSKIVGGTTALVNEYPFMAGLYDSSRQLMFCGGSIIHYRYILTAAHCANSYPNPTTIAVVVGDHDYTIGSETSYNAVYIGSTWTKHPSYVSTSTSQANDIALLMVNKDIQYSRGVGPICLPFAYTSTSFDNVALDAMGWGTTSLGGPTSNYLRKVTLYGYSLGSCQSYYSLLTSSQMCTYASNKDSCQYDSGGTIVYRGGRFIAVGVISYGSGCAIQPGVNTKVSAYIPWIQQTTGLSFCSKS